MAAEKSDPFCDDIVGLVYPSTLMVGDTLLFEDKTQFAKTKRWSFGRRNNF
jgi:peptide subunit release factor RF-3